MRRSILPSLFFLLTALSALPAASIRVDGVRGSDLTGKGTPAEPYRTITRALALARSGDEIQAAPGTYDYRIGESFPLSFPPGVGLTGLAGPRALFIVCDNPWTPAIRLAAGGDSRARFSSFTLVGGWTCLQVEFAGGGQSGSRLDLADLALEDGGCALTLATTAAATGGKFDLVLEDCLLAGHWGGGAVLAPAAGTVLFTARNTVIQNNGGDALAARPAGGAQVSLDLLHCTLARNGGKGVMGTATGIGFTAANSILWGNRMGDLSGLDPGGVFHCLLSTGSALGGRGNRTGDPRFLDERDWHLGHGSAALGVGDPTRYGIPKKDIDGQFRSTSTAPDAGADQQELHTLTQDPRGMRIFRPFTLRVWSWPRATVVFLISFDTVFPGFTLPPLQGLLQLDYTMALEIAGSGVSDLQGILDFGSSGFRGEVLLGTAVAFQAVAFNQQGTLTTGHFTGAVKTWFIKP